MTWCPLGGVAYPAWENTFTDEQTRKITLEITQQANNYHVEPWVISLAWLLKHPAKIFPIIGSTTPERIVMAKKAFDLNYSRKDWYRLLEARNGSPVS